MGTLGGSPARDPGVEPAGFRCRGPAHGRETAPVFLLELGFVPSGSSGFHRGSVAIGQGVLVSRCGPPGCPRPFWESGGPLAGSVPGSAARVLVVPHWGSRLSSRLAPRCSAVTSGSGLTVGEHLGGTITAAVLLLGPGGHRQGVGLKGRAHGGAHVQPSVTSRRAFM